MEQKQMHLFCRVCQEVFAIPARRGRPPVKCDACRAKEEPQVYTKPKPIAEPPVMVIKTPESTKQMFVFCKACEGIVVIPARRGHPPKYCAECLKNGRASTHDSVRSETDIIKANQRCDRLEMMLKSRGTHISQQKDWLQ